MSRFTVFNLKFTVYFLQLSENKINLRLVISHGINECKRPIHYRTVTECLREKQFIKTSQMLAAVLIVIVIVVVGWSIQPGHRSDGKLDSKC